MAQRPKPAWKEGTNPMHWLLVGGAIVLFWIAVYAIIGVPV